MPTPQAITSTSQQYLEIFDITNNLVILKDGSVSLILTVTAMNFGLLAEEEQDAIIYGYAGLLNSLNYSIQILIRSQTKDVTSYLNVLKAKEDEIVNRTKKEQIKRYREFVADLVKERNVLDKKFYVIIPANALELGLVTNQSVLPGVKSPDISTYDRSVIIERARNTLEPKRDHIMAQFGRIGLLSRQLKTQEIIQLFYSIYNPEASEGQRITDSNSYTTSLVHGKMEEEVFGNTRSETPENLNTSTHTSPQAPLAPAAETVAPKPEAAPQPVIEPKVNPLLETPAIVSKIETPISPAPQITPPPQVSLPPEPTTHTSTPKPFETDKTPPPSKVNIMPIAPVHVASAAPALDAIAPTKPNDTTQSAINDILKTTSNAAEETLPPPVEIV